MSRDLMRQGNRFTSDTAYYNRVNVKTSRCEYVGGSKESNFIYLLCKDCGSVFRHSKDNLKPSHKKMIECPKCKQALSEKRDRDEQVRREQRAQELLVEQQKRQEIREARQRAKIKKYVCQRCGKEFESKYKRLYCSKECTRRQCDSNREHIRRTQCMSQKHDSISLKGLAIRDKDRCWICKRKVDWNDCETRLDGTFIAYKNYPSIDHVTPLSKGGSHTWDNVKLAHRKCNNSKAAKVIFEEGNGQMRFAL